MKLCLYTSTVGLERFPKLDRFRVWESMHKQLMRADPEYRRHVRRSTWRYIWVTVLFTVAILSLSFAMGLFAVRGRAAIALSLMCLGVGLVQITYSIVASSRLQEFMNSKVGEALR